MKSKTLSYDAALLELKQILQEMQSDQTGIDKLSQQISRSKELLVFCKNKLREIETVITSEE